VDFSKFKFLPRRTGIHYENNGGYALTIDHLPWGNAAFSVRRFRITGTQNLAMVEETTGRGGKLELSNLLPPPGVELIILKRQ
jgi:hypothetical protein